MPFGDGTGPYGTGPVGPRRAYGFGPVRVGWGGYAPRPWGPYFRVNPAAFFSTFVPGYGWGWGFGRGRGRGRGFGMGMGRGRGRGFGMGRGRGRGRGFGRGKGFWGGW